MKQYAGTQAAADAATLIAGLADKPETRGSGNEPAPATCSPWPKEEFRTGRCYDCLQKCDQL